MLDDNQQAIDAPVGTVNGINYNPGSYVFQLTAPNKDHVFLLCPENEYGVDVNYQMTPTLDGDAFWIELPQTLFTDDRNTYQFLVDGELKVADPYSTVVLDPSNDAGVPSDVKNILPPYPTGLTLSLIHI